jgi:anaerobic ribonucleoside-triphosphate reductase activating protein
LSTIKNQLQARWNDEEVLHVARVSKRCTVLGPGIRAVVWTQGCPLRCADCVAPETLPFAGGMARDPLALADELADLPDIEGVTFSGGDPMSQAPALVALIDRMKSRRDLSVMSYTGFPLEAILQHGTPAQHALLRRLDILVDGPYVRTRHTDLRWRGSDNQRVLLLSERHRDLADRLDDRGNRIELEIECDSVAWMGIPPPGFRDKFRTALHRQGIRLLEEGDTP